MSCSTGADAQCNKCMDQAPVVWALTQHSLRYRPCVVVFGNHGGKKRVWAESMLSVCFDGLCDCHDAGS